MLISEGVGDYGYHSKLRNHLFCHDANGGTIQNLTDKHDFVLFNIYIYIYQEKTNSLSLFDKHKIHLPCNLCSATLQYPKTEVQAARFGEPEMKHE